MPSTDLTALEKEFGSKALDHPSVDRSFRLSVWVPTEFVGKVIGTRGTVIQHIQRETNTRVASLPAIGEKLWSPLVITGTPGSVMLAYCLVAKIIEEEDDVVAEFYCPFLALRSPKRFGQFGTFTRKLSADHSVRVFVPDSSDFGRDNRDRDPLMSLEGPIAAVWRALADIVQLLNGEEVLKRTEELSLGGNLGSGSGATERSSWRSTDERPLRDWKSGRERQVVDVESIKPVEVEDERFEHSFSFSVDVPASIVGLLLSSRGTGVNLIATIGKATYTFISSPKRNRDDDSRSANSIVVFTIAGKNSHNVALASSLLLRVVQGERIKDVLKSVTACQPQPTGSSAKSAAETDGHAKYKNKSNDRLIANGGSTIKRESSKKDSVDKPPAATENIPISEGSPEMDEEVVNAHLFTAPIDEAESSNVSSRRSGSTSGRGSGKRGGRSSGRGRRGRPSR